MWGGRRDIPSYRDAKTHLKRQGEKYRHKIDNKDSHKRPRLVSRKKKIKEGQKKTSPGGQ